MSREDEPGLAGLDTEAAVEAVLEREDDADPESVRDALSRVSEDGVVTEPAIEDAVADASAVVATPENRTEMAKRKYVEVAAAAEPVADLGAVRSRLDTYEGRLDDVASRTERVVADLRSLVERGDPDPYALGREIRDLTRRANSAHREADELAADLDSFQRWLDDPAARAAELEADLTAVAADLDDLERRVGDLNAGVDWFHISLRHRVLCLLAADAEAELADLRAWPGENAGGDDLDAVADRLGTLEGHLDDTADRLAAAAGSAWRERFGERLAAAEDDLDAFDTPIAWEEVEATVEEHRTPTGGP